MKTVLILAISVSVFVVRAEILTGCMSRNPRYDNKKAQPAKYLTTMNVKSLLHCATFCRSKIHCKSVFYNADNSLCQMLSSHLGPGDIIEDEDSQEWKYYEFKKKCNQWHDFRHHRYKVDSNLRNFTDAQEFCSSLNNASHVIEVNSQEENDWLVDLTKDLCGAPAEYWINSRDDDNSGNVFWLDSKEWANYTNWYPHKPDNTNEKCIGSSTNYGGQWNDIECADVRPVVCELDTI